MIAWSAYSNWPENDTDGAQTTIQTRKMSIDLGLTKFKALDAWRKTKADERNGEMLAAVQEELDGLGMNLVVIPTSEGIGNAEQVQEAFDTAASSLATSEKNLQETQEKLDAATTRIAALERTPDSDGNTVPVTESESDKVVTTTEEPSVDAVLDSLPHNQEADELLGFTNPETVEK